MYVLGIETSCDETAVAIYQENKGIICQRLYSQVETHQPFKGVVPELASREHQAVLPRLLQELFTETEIDIRDISLIASTQGPGLIGALIAGFTFARALASFNKIPFVGVNHLEAHVLTCLLNTKQPNYPFLCLLASGGHTILLKTHRIGMYEVLGVTRDDSAGEAFDKGASLLNLPYANGKTLSEVASTATNISRHRFKTPFLVKGKHRSRENFDFSFSGLKTQLRLLIEDLKVLSYEDKANIAASYQEAIVESLVETTRRSIDKFRHSDLSISEVVLAGGVSANQRLREVFSARLNPIGVSLVISPPHLCTDNAAMIAHLGYIRRSAAKIPTSETDKLFLQPRNRWPISELTPV